MDFQRKSEQLAAEDVTAINKERTDLRQQLLGLRQRRRDELGTQGVVNHLSECRLGDADLRAACEIFNSIDGATVQALKTGKLQAPSVPLEQEQQLIIDMENEIASSKRSLPWWCRHICRNRDLWRMTAVAVDSDPQVAFLVIVAIQNPLEVVFLELRRTERVFDLELVGGVDYHLPRGFKVFDIHPLKHWIEDDVPIDPELDLYVFPGCRFDGGSVVVSTCEPFEHFVGSHPPVGKLFTTSVTRSRVEVPKDETARLLLENPFLTQADIDRAFGKVPKPRVGKKARIAGKKIDESEDEPEVTSSENSEVDDPFAAPDGAGDGFDEAELAALREDYREEEEEFKHFYVHLRGGEYVYEHEGIVANCASSNARGAWVRYWCDCYSWQTKYQFHFSVYGYDDSVALARELCRRGDFFFELWLAQDSDTFLYADHHFTDYTEQLPWLEFIASKDAASVSFIRGLDIRRTIPINPEWVG